MITPTPYVELEIESSLKETRYLESVAFLREEVLHEITFTAPIHRLPPELLSQIFVEYTYDVTGDPWNLIFVCRLWKEVAFAALLWTKILCSHWSFAGGGLRLYHWPSGNSDITQ